MRPAGHEGPHLITDHYGRFITWENDWECPCSDCQSEDPNDWCLIYNVISKADARWLQNSLRPIYSGSPEEWISAGTAVLMSLPTAVRKNHLGQYFFCNIRDRTYVIGSTCDVVAKQYAAQHFLPSEGWTIFGVIIQAKHL